MAPVPVLLLGTDHLSGWSGEGTHDILSDARQREREELVTRLARFSPTKIAVEVLASKQARLDSTYEEYLAGERQADRDEIVQIGCRLAQLTKAPLLAIDANWTLTHAPMEEYFQSHPDERVDGLSLDSLTLFAELWQQLGDLSLSEFLARLNEPPLVYLNDREYLDRCLPISAADSWAGVELVASWYRRNLKILANLQRIAEPGDRIFALFGSGHVASLRHFLEVSARFDFVSPLDFLRDRSP